MIAETGNITETRSTLLAHDLDIVLRDLSMSSRDGIELRDHVKATKPASTILFLSMRDKKSVIFRASRAGVDRYMVEQNAADDSLATKCQLLGAVAATPFDVRRA
ncbi:MAG TPA: response regulator [Candidatus Binataceae bacterium]|nr:response regulator [Candidatus Binataceae bacterium]